MLGHHRGRIAGREMAEIDFRQTEQRIFGGKRDVAAGHHRERSTQTPAGNARDHRLRQGAQHFVAPAANFFAHFITYPLRLAFHLERILLQVLSGAEVITGPGEHHDTSVFVVANLGQQIEHFTMQLRTHRIALLRTVKRNRRDTVLR
jgi:hypothetical protein